MCAGGVLHTQAACHSRSTRPQPCTCSQCILAVDGKQLLPSHCPTPHTLRHPPPPRRAVLSVLQFWAAFFLPVLLTTRGQLRAYLEWRRERLGQQRAQRRNRGRAAAAHLPPTGAGSAAAASGAGGSPVTASGSGNSSNKSSPLSPQSAGGSGGWFGRGAAASNGSGSASSPRSSLSSDSIDDAAGLSASPVIPSLSQLLKPPRRRGDKPHPEDWQVAGLAVGGGVGVEWLWVGGRRRVSTRRRGRCRRLAVLLLLIVLVAGSLGVCGWCISLMGLRQGAKLVW